jgi:hypothetical protein
MSFDNITSETKKLGEGSFGIVYALDESRAVKVHIIEQPDIVQISQIQQYCDTNWKHEFDMHMGIFQCVEPKIKTFMGHIVQPLQYQYTTRTDKQIYGDFPLNQKPDCRIVMERIVSGNSDKFKDIYNRKLNDIVKSSDIHSVTKTSVPYLYLGVAEETANTHGHIRLDMLIGVSEHRISNTISYYDVDAGLSLNLIHGMFNTFFTFIVCGYMPRDIEYVFNCKKYDGRAQTYFSVIDFNQVATIDQRAYRTGESYDVAGDAAQVYIDLCGIRKDGTRNTYYRDDIPTPQWAFLCNPLVTPSVFISLCKKMLLLLHKESAFKPRFIRFIYEITKYIHDNYLNPISCSYNWSKGNKFYDSSVGSIEVLDNLDNVLQKYFLYKVCHSLNARLQPNGDRHNEVQTIISTSESFDNAISQIKALDQSLQTVASNSDSIFDDFMVGLGDSDSEPGGGGLKRKSRTKKHVNKARLQRIKRSRCKIKKY